VITQSVCAVVITYHPTDRMIENLSSIVMHVKGMIVVDNGSSPSELDALRAMSRRYGITLIENGRNVGQAEALNQGVRRALQDGFDWVILFDQDSRLTPNFVEEMFAAWERHPQRGQVGSIHPRYIDPVTGRESFILRAKDGGPFKSITSGALMPAWIFDKIGFFASEYFIDEVDSEYCLRIRAAGYLVADSNQAVLLHNSGQPRPCSIMGFTFRPTYHSAIRRYYMSRNRVVVYRKYLRVFPRCILYSVFDSFRDTVKCFLGEHTRMRKFRNVLLGTWDGLLDRMGPREGL
jgi:rhamnosyltransferase